MITKNCIETAYSFLHQKRNVYIPSTLDWQNDEIQEVVLYYLIIINIVTFLVYGIDKLKAKKAMWRIRETSLLMLAVLGGSIGAWLGMKVWHHKTLHKKFRYGIPAIIIIQLAVIGYWQYQ